MKQAKSRRAILYGIVAVYVAGLVVFGVRYAIRAERWAYYQTNRHVYADGQVTNIGDVTARDGTLLATTKDGVRCYASDAEIRKATIHAVGDSNGFISTGVQNALLDRLTGYSRVNGFYTYTGQGHDVQLTIDPAISVAAQKALGKFNGCVGMANYQTGEILCMCSAPTFDVADEASRAAAQSGALGSVFVNRFLSSTYTPGSTFKMVTAYAALTRNGEAAYETAFSCRYGTEFDGETLSCVGRHNEVKLSRAFAYSCNAYFSRLAVTLGRDAMTDAAARFGFNRSFTLDGIPCATSSYGVKGTRDIDFGWSGIGQYTDQMNPYQYLCDICAIANGGRYVPPYLIRHIVASDGQVVYDAHPESVACLDPVAAGQVAELMDGAVRDNYRKATFGSLDVCGKTGTAEVGDGVENSLFVGFCKDPDLPLAFVVVVEGGGAGRASALSVANKTLQAAKNTLLQD